MGDRSLRPVGQSFLEALRRVGAALFRAATLSPVLFLVALLGTLHLSWRMGMNADELPEEDTGDPEPDDPVDGTDRGGPYGVDVSAATSAEAWACLRINNRVTYGLIRCYRSVGSVDPNCGATLEAASSAGIEHLDVYHFPTLDRPADTQVRDVFEILAQAPRVRTFWLDVETSSGNPSRWSEDPSVNRAFIEQALETAREEAASKGLDSMAFGVYTGRTSWRDVVGDVTIQELAPEGDTPTLWWPRYDDQPHLDDWSAFGGWDTPILKQWNPNQDSCGAAFDANWHVEPIE